jgi:hypothetical protein
MVRRIELVPEIGERVSTLRKRLAPRRLKHKEHSTAPHRSIGSLSAAPSCHRAVAVGGLVHTRRGGGRAVGRAFLGNYVQLNHKAHKRRLLLLHRIEFDWKGCAIESRTQASLSWHRPSLQRNPLVPTCRRRLRFLCASDSRCVVFAWRLRAPSGYPVGPVYVHDVITHRERVVVCLVALLCQHLLVVQRRDIRQELENLLLQLVLSHQLGRLYLQSRVRGARYKLPRWGWGMFGAPECARVSV